MSKLPKALWLKARLKETSKTPAGLAKHLGVHPPRAYEMIAGRRAILPAEIAKAAEFLEWSVEELLERLPPERRVLPAGAAPVEVTARDDGPLVRGVLALMQHGVPPDVVELLISGNPALKVRPGALRAALRAAK